MKTADLFSDQPELSAAIRAGGFEWLRGNRATVRAWAAAAGRTEAAEAAMAADIPPAASRQPVADLTVVIPCHNYAGFLGDLLASLKRSTVQPARVIVIDDASDDNPEPIARRYGADFLRINARHQAKACAAGFASVATKYVAFVDADDVVDSEYFRTALQQLETDPAAAFVFPWLEAFGEATGPRHGTEAAPEVLSAVDIESRNWCPAGSVYRSHVLRQSLALVRDRDPLCVCNDWTTARNVLRSGPWKALKALRPLPYRIHSRGQDHRTRPGTYVQQADLQGETVSIVVAFSGRWNAWQRLRGWILSQTWPASQTRLLILNSTHEALTAAALGLEHFAGVSLQVERIDAGRPRLAELDRRTVNAGTAAEIEAAVAGLYNAAVLMTRGEWLLFLEDDTIPTRPDAIRQLFRNVGPRVAAVSGVYRHRYHDNAVAFHLSGNVADLLPLEGAETEYVDGSGFGCLLSRRSVLLSNPLAGDTPRKFYDVDIGYRLKAAGWQWILDRSVPCDHLIGG
jgi:glycosyltransferase involved in cell wall biosynthesis